MRINLNGKIMNIKKRQCCLEFYNHYALQSARKRCIPLNKAIG